MRFQRDQAEMRKPISERLVGRPGIKPGQSVGFYYAREPRAGQFTTTLRLPTDVAGTLAKARRAARLIDRRDMQRHSMRHR